MPMSCGCCAMAGVGARAKPLRRRDSLAGWGNDNKKNKNNSKDERLLCGECDDGRMGNGAGGSGDGDVVKREGRVEVAGVVGASGGEDEQGCEYQRCQ